MNKKFFLALLMAVCCFARMEAQDKNRKDSTVVIFFNENKTERTKKKKSGEANIVKIAPLGLVSGTYPLLYERVVTDFFSIQAGGGLTGKNFWRNAIQKTDNEGKLNIVYPWSDNTALYDEAEPLFSFDYRKPQMGYMFTIQPRLYFESEAPDGSFLGISYDYYHYAFSIPGLMRNSNNETVHKGASKSEYENINDIMVHFGYQTVYDRLTMEYTTGIGLRSVKGTKYAAAYDSFADQFVEGNASYKQNIFNFGIGIKVGYHF
jgi:hypothetical protein